MTAIKTQELRNTLYELVVAATDGGGNGEQNVQAHQAMGVQLSNSVKKDGVTIVQVQDVKAIGKVTHTAIQALRELDALEVGIQQEQLAPEAVIDAVPQIEYRPSTEEALEYVCSVLLAAGLNLQDAVKVMRYGCATVALREGGSVARAAEALGIKPSYVHVLKRERPEVLEQGHG